MNSILVRLNKLKNILNQNNLNLNSIRNEINVIGEMETIDEYQYLNSLLYPEKYKGVRIPSQVPVPTCTFQLTARRFLATSTQGALVLYVNPWFLKSPLATGYSGTYTYDTGTQWITRKIFIKEQTGILYCRNSSVDGINPIPPGIYFTAWNFDQEIPNVYDKYRLVSASLNIRYGRDLLSSSGVLGGGILLDDTQMIGGRYYMSSDMDAEYDPTHDVYPCVVPLNKFGDFNLIRNLPYSQETSLMTGLRMLYFPVSNTDEEFVPLFSGAGVHFVANQQTPQYINPTMRIDNKYMKTNFGWLIYVQNGPLNYSRTIDIELCCNFECIPKAEYLEYFDVSTYKPYYSLVTEDQKKNIYEIVKKNAIQKINNFKIN